MRKLNHRNAVVLFSGGQDSSIALGWALDRFDRVETLGFNYGQRHNLELKARDAIRKAIAERMPEWGSRLRDDTVLNAGVLSALGETAMTHSVAIEMNADGLPTTFVPGRNLMFMVLAGAFAYRRNAGVIVGGMCQTDYSGYPDCREDTLHRQTDALRLGLNANIGFAAPLMHYTKGESWRIAERVGGDEFVKIVNELSHTCYNNVRDTRHDWGYGCGECPACKLRKKGWAEYQAMA
ncbi:MAG: 7-cyano-7-deazaguanine synthase QueC [Pseudomonadota bacterium]